MLCSMPNMDELVERLRNHPITVDEHLRDEQQAWVTDLHSLIEQVKCWLASGVEQGVFHLDDVEVQIDEQDVGTYDAPGLKITLINQHRQVLFTPQGFRIQGVVAFGRTRVIGFRGRVDMNSGPSKDILFRRQASAQDELPWYVLMSSGERRQLNEETFADVL